MCACGVVVNMKILDRECLQRGQLKNIVDEARKKGVCKNAAAFIRGLDKEFDEEEEEDITKAERWAAIKKRVLSWF